MSGQREDERRRLSQGLETLGLSIDEQTGDRLLDYLEQLRHWGKTYNLVAPGDMPFLLERHLLDSLAIARWCEAGPMLDVGTGAGFPGLPLAILEPQRRTVLIDGAGKKVRFLRHVVRRLSMSNVEAVHERIENHAAPGGFETITSRAFSSLADFVRGVSHLTSPDTRLLAMKGQVPEVELDELKALGELDMQHGMPGVVKLESVEPIDVPGLEAQRHLVILRVASN